MGNQSRSNSSGQGRRSNNPAGGSSDPSPRRGGRGRSRRNRSGAGRNVYPGSSTSGDYEGDTSMCAPSNVNSDGDTPARFTPYAGGIGRGGDSPNAEGSDSATHRVRVRLPRGLTQNDIIRFITTHVRTSIQIIRTEQVGNFIYLILPTANQARSVTQLNRFHCKGRTLDICLASDRSTTRPGTSGQTSFTQAQVTQTTHAITDELTRLIETRFNPELMMLNLDNVDAVTNMRREAMAVETRTKKKSNFWPAVLKMAGRLHPETVTVSFGQNELKSLEPIARLIEFLPNVRNLSLQDNHIATLRDFDFLAQSTQSPTELRELVLTGNPLRANRLAKTHDDSVFIGEMVQRFPHLQLLDLTPIPEHIRNNALISSSFRQGPSNRPSGSRSSPSLFPELPRQVQTNFFDGAATMELSNAFLTTFFNLYDNQRSALIDLYDLNAVFTLAVNVSTPPTRIERPPLPTTYRTAYLATPQGQRTQRNRSGGQSDQVKPPRLHESDWSNYTKYGRNIRRLKSMERLAAPLFTGNQVIVEKLGHLPRTIHPMDELQRFSVFAWQMLNLPPGAYPGPGNPPPANMPPAILISVSGEFYEPDRHVMHSFDRTLLLVPTMPQSRASQCGYPFSIRNDALVVRQYMGFDGWNPAKYAPSKPLAAVATAPSTSLSTASATPLPTSIFPPTPSITPITSIVIKNMMGVDVAVTPEQHAMVTELQSRTQLNPSFGVQCLQENGWNFDKSLQVIHQVKSSNQLPPQAFQP
ncbi:nuclear mRNA export, poly(A)+RNA binding protein [Dispira simplex]|nr:nuclear mRNA export, poly(A)+RNA binding protein [Dispira simplex]